MKTFKTSTYQSSYERCNSLKCDLCGKRGFSDGESWSNDQFEVAETKIQMKVGEAYPDGGNHKTTYVDICVECFKTKLLPWVAEVGTEGPPRVVEVDW